MKRAEQRKREEIIRKQGVDIGEYNSASPKPTDSKEKPRKSVVSPSGKKGTTSKKKKSSPEKSSKRKSPKSKAGRRES